MVSGTTDDLVALTAPSVEPLLAAAVAPEDVLRWRVRSVDHRPGRSTTVAYDVRVRTAAGERVRVVGLSRGTGPATTQHEGRGVCVWRYPHDPALPGLAVVTDRGALAALLAEVGGPAGELDVRVRTYRPGRRAVAEVTTPGERLFVRVLRPAVVEAAHARHVLLREAGLPVPRALGRRADGLLVTTALEGTSLRARLREGGAPVPGAAALLELLDLLPRQLLDLPRRRSWADAAGHYAGVLAAALPEEADRCRQLADRVLAVVDGLPADDPVHGDLYETALLLDGDRVSGLLDVDTAGPGRRADDLACLLGHAHVLAQLEPAHAATTTAVAERWLAGVAGRVDPVELRARVAGVVLSLATGPHRVQSADWEAVTRARLDLAEQWLTRAERPHARR